MFRSESPLSVQEELIVTAAVGTGFTVHSELGPGFREHIYERAYCLELDSRGIRYECEKRIEVRYKKWLIPGQTIDLVIEGIVLVELKTVPQLKPIHRAQVISYLKAMGLKVGLIMNFNAELFKAGIKRVVHTPRPPSTGAPGEPQKP